MDSDVVILYDRSIDRNLMTQINVYKLHNVGFVFAFRLPTYHRNRYLTSSDTNNLYFDAHSNSLENVIADYFATASASENESTLFDSRIEGAD